MSTHKSCEFYFLGSPVNDSILLLLFSAIALVVRLSYNRRVSWTQHRIYVPTCIYVFLFLIQSTSSYPDIQLLSNFHDHLTIFLAFFLSLLFLFALAFEKIASIFHIVISLSNFFISFHRVHIFFLHLLREEFSVHR